jgi:sulfur carrier protein
MITVQLNGEKKTLTKRISLSDAINLWSPTEKNFAVAVNKQFIPKVLYPETQLVDGDDIELLIPMQGG